MLFKNAFQKSMAKQLRSIQMLFLNAFQKMLFKNAFQKCFSKKHGKTTTFYTNAFLKMLFIKKHAYRTKFFGITFF